MAQATVAAAPTPTAWLAERGLVVGARVGSCVVAHHVFGTVIAVRSTDDLTVRWDDARTETVGWTAISPLGYVVTIEPVAATPSQWASAATHLENRIEHVRIDGIRWAVVTSGNSGKVYRLPADASECPWEWNTRTQTRCSHMLAVELSALEDELTAAPVTPIAAGFPSCRVCGESTDGPRRLCDDCAADQARRLDRASRPAVAA